MEDMLFAKSINIHSTETSSMVALGVQHKTDYPQVDSLMGVAYDPWYRATKDSKLDLIRTVVL